MHMETEREEYEREPGFSESMKRLQETRKKMKKIAGASVILVAIVLGLAAVVICRYLVPANYYNHAVDMMYAEEYAEAIEYLNKANGFKDSEALLEVCRSNLEGAGE